MLRIFFMTCFTVFGLAGAQAQTEMGPSPCHGDKISNTSGRMIGLRSGLAFQGYPGSQMTMTTWAPLDRLNVCQIGGGAVVITNLSKRNQTVKALRVYGVIANKI